MDRVTVEAMVAMAATEDTAVMVDIKVDLKIYSL